MEAIPEGLARTAGLITSAAAIMIVVFAAFTFGNFLVVKMLGFTLAVAVFIDATLVRIVIGPALLRIAGDWNWWPGGLHRGSRAKVIVAVVVRPASEESSSLEEGFYASGPVWVHSVGRYNLYGSIAAWNNCRRSFVWRPARGRRGRDRHLGINPDEADCRHPTRREVFIPKSTLRYLHDCRKCQRLFAWNAARRAACAGRGQARRTLPATDRPGGGRAACKCAEPRAGRRRRCGRVGGRGKTPSKS